MRLTVRHLELVLAVAELRSVTKAAVRLERSQPTVTLQLRRVEKFLGAPLFVRSPEGMLTTEAGSRVVGEARRILASAADMDESARNDIKLDLELT